MTEFLSTKGLSSHVIDWVLKRIPEDRGLEWLLLESTEATMYDMWFNQGNGITKTEFDKVFHAVHKERSHRLNKGVLEKDLRNKARDHTQRKAEHDLITLLRTVAPDADDRTLQDIAQQLHMSPLLLRTFNESQLKVKIASMFLDKNGEEIVGRAWENVREEAKETRRLRTGAPYAQNTYFV